jgi:hypothetical protein
MFGPEVIEKIKTRILGLKTFFPPKVVPFMRYVEKYCRAG